LIRKIYQALKTVFDHISRHLEVDKKYPTTHHIFNSLLGARKHGQTRSFLMFNMYNWFNNYSYCFGTAPIKCFLSHHPQPDKNKSACWFKLKLKQPEENNLHWQISLDNLLPMTAILHWSHDHFKRCLKMLLTGLI